MRFLAAVPALVLAVSSVLAHPSGDSSTLEERQNNIVITKGPEDSTVYPRLEVRWMKDNYIEQYWLLCLALQRWQNQDENSPTSYFGVSKVHGVPRRDYNGVGQCAQCQGTDGYCPHDSVHFPGWHRVYVALFEQEFLKIVRDIAQEYPEGSQRDKMVKAAKEMRWPFWDWAAKPPPGRPHLPWLVSDPTCVVTGPQGQITINNPLFRYDFKDPSGMVYWPFVQWKKTYRWPKSNDVNAVSNNDAARDAFNNIRQSIQDQIYQLFSNCHEFLHFSNDGAESSSAGCALSIESIHNTIHNTAGGPGQNGVLGGHMTYLPTSSFDPIFWLLHCNVDRLFAMWQTLNPDSYGASETASHATWTIAPGSQQDAHSPLTPFYKNNNGEFWTTNDVRDWKIFKYTYPEYTHSDGSKAAISGIVNDLYGPNAGKTAGMTKRAAQLGDLLDVVNGTVDALADAMPDNPIEAVNGTLFQYFANVQSPRYALGGSYFIYLFNGDPTSEDPKTWLFDPKLIGPIGVVAQDGMESSNQIITGQISLTRCLQEHVNQGTLPALTEAIVGPFLTSTLKWRIQGPKGNKVEPSTLKGFVVSIFASTASQPASPAELPAFSQFIPLLDVTKGQSGGANETLVQYIDTLL